MKQFLLILRRILFGNRRRLRALQDLLFSPDFAERFGIELHPETDPEIRRFIIPTVRHLSVKFQEGMIYTFPSTQTAEENIEELREFWMEGR